MSHSRGLQIQDPVAHFRGFGCSVAEVDGHDVEALKAELVRRCDTVKVIVANTVKGCGCRTLQKNHYEWHRKSPDEEEYALLMEEIGETAV
jgi:transketolase